MNFFNATALIEDAVRTVTDNPDYQFGDLTKGAIKELSGKDMEDYEFGDISKRIAGQAQEGFVSTATSITGKDTCAYKGFEPVPCPLPAFVAPLTDCVFAFRAISLQMNSAT